MNDTNKSRRVVHLVHEVPDAMVLGVVAAQKEEGLPVEIIRLDEVKDWASVVDRVLGADSVCSW